MSRDCHHCGGHRSHYGDIVLGVCRNCGAAESELDDAPCPGEDRGGCDCAALMAGNGPPHHSTCPMYKEPVCSACGQPLVTMRRKYTTITTVGCGNEQCGNYGKDGDDFFLTDPAPASSGDFSIGGTLWPGLSKLIEEAGEVGELLPEIILLKALGRIQQTNGKLIGSEGRVDHWSGDLRLRFTEELGDLTAAIRFFERHNDLGDTESRADEKLDLFEQWHRDALAARKQ